MFCKREDTRLWYERRGRGIPLIVQSHPVHGSSLYRQTLSSLEDFCEVIHYDCRNTGLSDISDSVPVSPELLADDLEHLRKKLNIEEFILLAHSAGGNIALWYCMKYPSRVRKLILVSSVDNLSRRQALMQEQARYRLNEVRYVDALQELTRRMGDRSDVSVLTSVLLQFHDPHVFIGFLSQPANSSLDFASFSRTNALALTNEALMLPEPSFVFPMKTCLVYGKSDLESAEVRDFSARFENPRMEAIREAGHFPWIEKPELFFDILSEFIL